MYLYARLVVIFFSGDCFFASLSFCPLPYTLLLSLISERHECQSVYIHAHVYEYARRVWEGERFTERQSNWLHFCNTSITNDRKTKEIIVLIMYFKCGGAALKERKSRCSYCRRIGSFFFCCLFLRILWFALLVCLHDPDIGAAVHELLWRGVMELFEAVSYFPSCFLVFFFGLFHF